MNKTRILKRGIVGAVIGVCQPWVLCTLFWPDAPLAAVIALSVGFVAAYGSGAFIVSSTGRDIEFGPLTRKDK